MTINGTVVKDLAIRVSPSSDVVTVDGRTVSIAQQTVVYLLNKPRGIISTAADERGRTGVTDLVPSTPRVFPVGRLDRESEGLLVLTNDGELSLRLTHPRYVHTKRYEVWTSVPQRGVQELIRGLSRPYRIAGKSRRFDAVRYLGRDSGLLHFEVTVHEGLKHLVRRLLDKVGLETKRLVRTAHGPFTLGDLTPGTWRTPIEAEWLEVQKLVERGAEPLQDV